jgi:hypothetical protein
MPNERKQVVRQLSKTKRIDVAKPYVLEMLRREPNDVIPEEWLTRAVNGQINEFGPLLVERSAVSQRYNEKYLVTLQNLDYPERVSDLIGILTRLHRLNEDVFEAAIFEKVLNVLEGIGTREVEEGLREIVPSFTRKWQRVVNEVLTRIAGGY